MPTIKSGNADIFYETRGKGSPVLLLAGLGGVGRGWGKQIDLFAQNHFVIVPDHRGAGRSSMTAEGQTIAQHAEDAVALIKELGVGPTHVIGSSTGGAVVQVLALDHPDIVKTVSIVSSWGGPDPYFRRQFLFRRQYLADAGVAQATEVNAMFLFDPKYQSDHADKVADWIEMASASPFNLEVAQKRIDMILAHDQRARLKDIRKPVLVLGSTRDLVTPLHLSEEIAAAIPGAELAVLDGGHYIYLEVPEVFHERVETFIAKNDG
jgi:aminoacrylate hydrolase